MAARIGEMEFQEQNIRHILRRVHVPFARSRGARIVARDGFPPKKMGTRKRATFHYRKFDPNNTTKPFKPLTFYARFFVAADERFGGAGGLPALVDDRSLG